MKTILNHLGEKETTLKHMMKILKIKTIKYQKLSEFISEIRVEANNIFGRDNKEKGLLSKKARLVLQELKPRRMLSINKR